MASFVPRAVATAVATAALAAPLTIAPAADATAPAARPAVSVRPAPAGDQAMTTMARRYAAMLRRLRGARFEQAFIAGMIPHHQAAIAMARLELARGTHPRLKAMARDIIAGQSREVGRMTGWLHTWYGLTPAQAASRAPAGIRGMDAMMGSHMRAMVNRLAAVPAGHRFDKAFMTAMIPHHEAAVVEARAIPGHTTHHRLDVIGRHIISSQSAEIVRMRGWLRLWYGTRVGM